MSRSAIFRCAACLSLSAALLLLLRLLGSPAATAHQPQPVAALAYTLAASDAYTVYIPLIQRHVWVPAPLQNGSFEGDSAFWKDPSTGEVHNSVSVPDAWHFYRDATLGKLPEMAVIEKVYPYLNPPRVYSGTQALKWFTQYANGDLGVYQQVPAEVGHLYRAQGYAHVWYSQLNDPHLSQYHDDAGNIFTIPDGNPGMEVMIGLDPKGGQDPWATDVVWTSKNIYDQFDQVAVQAMAEAPTITVFIRARTLYPFKHTHAYWDEVSLQVQH